jgi:hypothetical protein
MASNKYNKRRWSVPSKRAKGYAEDRREKVHTYGPKKGQELTDYEAGMRSGYLQCQTDHAGLYKYKKAIADGHDKKTAAEMSYQKGGVAAKKGKKSA